MRTTLPCLLLAAFLTACARPEPVVEQQTVGEEPIPALPPDARAAPPLTDARSASLALLTLVRHYDLPPRSVEPTPHRDAPVNSVIRQLQRIADEQGLIFDGRHAAQGLVVIGRPGIADDILLALAVYHGRGRLGIQHLPDWAEADTDAGRTIQRNLLTAIARIQP